MSATHKTYATFEREFAEGLLDITNVLKEVEGFETIIQASNHLITPQKDAPDMKAIQLEKGIDPHRILNQLVTEGNFIHGEDNHVNYYTCKKGEGGDRQYEIILQYRNKETGPLGQVQEGRAKGILHGRPCID